MMGMLDNRLCSKWDIEQATNKNVEDFWWRLVLVALGEGVRKTTCDGAF